MLDIGKFLSELKRSGINIPPGSSTQGFFESMVSLFRSVGPEYPPMLLFRPGDQYIQLSDDIDASLSSPVAYDIWYLKHTDSILPINDRGSSDEIMEVLSDWLSNMGGIKPLKTMASASDLQNIGGTWEIKSYFQNVGPYMIKTMRYESILKSCSTYYGSGFNKTGGSYPVYFAFPVGPLGVMEVLSIVSSDQEYSVTPEQTPITSWEELISPVPDTLDSCIGNNIVTKSYLIGQNTEYPSEEFKDMETVLPHKWMRYFLKADETWPRPGSFVGLLARPMPYHAWWFQESAPFLYSGNWFETEFYTGGEILTKTAPTGSDISYTYSVQVRDEQISIKATDLWEYEVGDIVTVLKRTGVTGESFKWSAIGNMVDVQINIDWQIIPITFFE